MKEPTGSPPPPLSLWMKAENICNGSASRALAPPVQLARLTRDPGP